MWSNVEKMVAMFYANYNFKTKHFCTFNISSLYAATM